MCALSFSPEISHAGAVKGLRSGRVKLGKVGIQSNVENVSRSVAEDVGQSVLFRVG